MNGNLVKLASLTLPLASKHPTLFPSQALALRQSLQHLRSTLQDSRGSMREHAAAS